MSTIPEMLNTALEHHRSGRLQEAAAIYEQILRTDPGHPDALHLLGVISHQMGNTTVAIELINRAIAASPDVPDFHINLGNVLYAQGKFDQAVASYERAVALNPNGAEVYNNLATMLHAQGKMEAAESYYQRALAIDPAYAEAHCNLGNLLKDWGRLEDAIASHEKALASNPKYAEAHNNLGNVLQVQGKLQEAIDSYRRALAFNPEHVPAHMNLANALVAQGRLEEAAKSFKKALRLQPGDPSIRTALRRLYSQATPPSRFAMINDRARIDAYDRAIRKAVGPETRVLDAGDGAGLLAMMAARAGSPQVTTCQRVDFVAEKVRQIVEKNDYGSAITVIAKPLTEVHVGAGMPEKADVMTVDVSSNELLAQQVLPVLEHAHAYLLKENAKVIPQSATVKACLIGGDAILEQLFLGQVAGFEMAMFNEFTPHKLHLQLDGLDYTAMSEEMDIFQFDFSQKTFPAESKIIPIRVTRSGRCAGLAQWTRLSLDDELTLENRRGSREARSHWLHTVYPFSKPMMVLAGQTLHIRAAHNRSEMFLDLYTG